MNYDNNRHNAHNEIDRIFKILFPARNMAERPEQAALCHRMLDAMLDGGIALCDAGTGIGKTYAYLVAGTVYSGTPMVAAIRTPNPRLSPNRPATTSEGTYRWNRTDRTTPIRNHPPVALIFRPRFLRNRSSRLGSVSLLCGAEKPEKLKKPFW